LLTTQTAAAAAAPTTNSYSKEDRGYKYWDDPNELIERLRLLYLIYITISQKRNYIHYRRA